MPSVARHAAEAGSADVSGQQAGAPRGFAPVTILVADADPEVGQPLATQLRADGYEAVLAVSAEQATMLAELRRPSLGIFGRLESARASLELLERVRSSPAPPPSPRCASSPWSPEMPVIMLSSGEDDLDLLRAFEAGADDLLIRPPRYLELRVRVRALLRRTVGLSTAPIHAVGLTIDLRAREARLHGRRLDLRRMEFELLVQLAADPGRVCPRQELLSRIWGYRSTSATRTLDSHASRLRRKLSRHDDRRWIVSVRGVGYRLI